MKYPLEKNSGIQIRKTISFENRLVKQSAQNDLLVSVSLYADGNGLQEQYRFQTYAYAFRFVLTDAHKIRE